MTNLAFIQTQTFLHLITADDLQQVLETAQGVRGPRPGRETEVAGPQQGVAADFCRVRRRAVARPAGRPAKRDQLGSEPHAAAPNVDNKCWGRWW